MEVLYGVISERGVVVIYLLEGRIFKEFGYSYYLYDGIELKYV